jgi:3-hydroxy acid dehydrogenase/malonic semialdehyde reductase
MPYLPRVAVITGASAGFGEAFARRFAAVGVKVVATARRLDRLEALAEAHPDLILPLALDLRDTAAVREVLTTLPASHADVDLLINNAGMALGLGPAQTAEVADWDQMLDTNVRGLLHCTHALLPGMVARGRGHVIHLGSVAGTHPYPGGNVYGATKAFVHQFSQNLRSDLHGTGVRMTCIEPGMCGGTEFSEVRFGGDVRKAEAVYAGMTPLSAEDIAEAVWWTATLPPHVNVNTLEIMPTAQSFGGFQVARAG